MKNKKIKLAYRLVIDSNSTPLWERYVFEDTWREYKMQEQVYNSKENPKLTFRELFAENDKAEKLHYLTGMAANSYISQFKGRLPHVEDVLGNNFMPFSGFKLDIINSDIADGARHKIGITFYSPLLTLVDVVNNCYLISENDISENGNETMMLAFQPRLGICFVQ